MIQKTCNKKLIIFITINTDQIMETTLIQAAIVTTLQPHTKTIHNPLIITHPVMETHHHIMAATKPMEIHHIQETIQTHITVFTIFYKILGNTTYLPTQNPYYNNDQYYYRRRNFANLNDFFSQSFWVMMVLFLLTIMIK